MSDDSTSVSAAGSAPNGDQIKQIIERIREEFEQSFHSTPDPEVRRQRVEQSLTNNQLNNTCQAQCMAAYVACRNGGGTPTACQAALNACLANC